MAALNRRDQPARAAFICIPSLAERFVATGADWSSVRNAPTASEYFAANGV